MIEETHNQTEPTTDPEQAEGRDDEPGDTQPLSGEPQQQRPPVPRHIIIGARPPPAR